MCWARDPTFPSRPAGQFRAFNPLASWLRKSRCTPVYSAHDASLNLGFIDVLTGSRRIPSRRPGAEPEPQQNS